MVQKQHSAGIISSISACVKLPYCLSNPEASGKLLLHLQYLFINGKLWLGEDLLLLESFGHVQVLRCATVVQSGAVWWTLLWSSKSFSMKAKCYWPTDKLAETSVDNVIPLNGVWGSRMSHIRRTQLRWLKHLTMMPPRWCVSGIPRPVFHDIWGRRKITSLLTSIISLENTPVPPQTSWRK